MPKANNSVFQDRFREIVGETATQEEIAKIVNSSRQNVGNWLSGKSKPDINALAEIAKGYNVSADYLLGLTDIKTADTDVQAVCNYLGLPEESVTALNNLKTKDTLNVLVQSELFRKLLLDFYSLTLYSSLIESIDTPDGLAFLRQLPTEVSAMSELLDRGDRCDLQRFKASETLSKILDLFDFRTNEPEKYAMINEMIKAIDKEKIKSDTTK